MSRVSVGCDPEVNVFNIKKNNLDNCVGRYPTDAPRLGEQSLGRYQGDWQAKVIAQATKKLGTLHFEEGGIEFHPGPAFDPTLVVRRLYALMWRVTQRALGKDRVLVVGAYGSRPMGGHIHLGGDANLLRPDQYLYNKDYSESGDNRTRLPNPEYKEWVENEFKIRRAVPTAVSLLKILEDPDLQARRHKAGYGQLWVDRCGVKPSGRKTIPLPTDYTSLTTRGTKDLRQTWEIRSPSPDWIAHPSLAGAALSLAKKAAEGRVELYKVLEKDYKNFESSYNHGQKQALLKLAPILKDNLAPEEVETILDFSNKFVSDRYENIKAGIGPYIVINLKLKSNVRSGLTRRPAGGIILREGGPD